MDEIVIRPWSETDSYEDLTKLLHSAYRIWADQDVRFTATNQPVAVTVHRVSEGQCFVAELDGAIVGTITVFEAIKSPACEHYRKPGVYVFGQFGVLPEHRKSGIGSRLLERAENHARELGAKELACDTAAIADSLLDYYQAKGFNPVDEFYWHSTNYKSIVLSKPI